MTDDYPELERLLDLKEKRVKELENHQYPECTEKDGIDYQTLKSQIINEHQIVERAKKRILEWCDARNFLDNEERYALAEMLEVITGIYKTDWTKTEIQQLLDNKEGKT